MLKMALFDAKMALFDANVAVLPENGAFAVFFRPHHGGFDSSRVPTPGNLPSKAEKMPMHGGQPEGGWAQVELTDALVCCCILYKALTIECTQLLC